MKKTLSIILAILMIVTTIPFVFAADETPDFSDAKVLSTDADGYLYIDGEKISINTNIFNEEHQLIPSGKYILEGDIAAINCTLGIKSQENVIINLDGYKWTFEGLANLLLEGELSIYDLSEKETGKLVASSSWGVVSIQDKGAVFNLYSGTLESINTYALRCTSGTVNLYGGKIKGSKYAISYMSSNTKGLNIDDTVIESGDGYADIFVFLGINVIAGDIDVTDYKGDSLTASVSLYDTVGKITVFKGIKDAQDAEKYQITDVACSESYGLFWEKTEYDEATGEKSIYTAKNAFTQQPSAENGYTVDFSNPNATFQWYEAEKIVLTPDNVTAIEGVIFENEKWLHDGWYVDFFTVDVEAGDTITASTTSARSFDLNVYTEDYSINEYVRATGKASVTIDSDAEVIVGIDVDVTNETTEFEIELIRTSELDETETDKTLQNPECGKTYVCKATVGEKVYASDSVVGHSLVSVDTQTPTCTEIGWEAYEYCTACDYSTYVEIPAGHAPLEAVTENEVAPKCGVAGSYDLVVYCDDCGAELDRETKTVDALTHTDADGDYICDHGCGYEYEKPADPTPEAPEDTESEVCEDCGKVHDGFFAEIICFFTKIINFFKNLFA